MGHATLAHNGAEWRSRIPAEAVPDCESCQKPELSPENEEVLAVYLRVIHQQTFGMDGTRLGLRFEAAKAAIEWADAAGEISDQDLVMERIWHLDRTVNDIQNAKSAARTESGKDAASNTQ